MMLRLLLLLVLGQAALSAETSFDDAAALFQAERYPEARDAFEALAAANPHDAAVQYHLGVLALRRNAPDAAIDHLERATAAAPNKAEYFIELGGAYGAAASAAPLLGKLAWAKKCLAALEQAVVLDPESIPARNALITFYREAPPIAGGGIQHAYDQAFEIRKRDVVAGSAILGQLYASQRRYDDAFTTYEAALAEQPANYQMLYLIGRTAAETGENLERGEQALRQCLTLTPGKDDQGYAAAHWRLGHIAEKRGDLVTARKEFEEALREHPGFEAAAESLAKLGPAP